MGGGKGKSSHGPVASKHGNRRSLVYAGSMAIGRTTGRQRHGVGKGGEREQVGGGGYRGLERRGTETKRRRARRANQEKERGPWEGEREKAHMVPWLASTATEDHWYMPVVWQ